uniref:X-ray radiation resistance-associated protein 1 n=1 Tax=Pogona vitticeps TaxID=103695 RepID=A0ABM5FVS8_9SAUR
MATTGMYKLDDGNSFPTNCFPARSLLRPRDQEGAGHWQVARRTAEETKIELLFGTKASQVRWKAEGVLTLRHLDEKTLDGSHLIKLHHVKIPSDLCSVNISNQNFVSAKEEDFEAFTSVAYINATENLLTLEAFRKFPELRELELSLNGLRNLKINAGDFPHLEVLDLSYNNLSPEDVQVLGVLPHLKVLHLTANGLNSLPLDLAVPESESCPMFPALEVLLLDDNHLSHPNVFVSLANLRSLKQLNLDKNGIKEVPYLHHINHSRFSIHPLSAKSGIKAGLRSRKTARKRFSPDGSRRFCEKPEYIILHSTRDPDRTEVVFPSWSPEPTEQEDSAPPRHVPETSSASDVSSEFTLPLPELRFLSLANNQIEHEEDLLAVALFPSLTELTFYGNPFTISRSGDPPLLTSFLQNKLGIKMIRKKISKLEKPRIFIPIKPNRKVTSQLPKVRKRPRRIEVPLETTFWQLWTGADLLDESKSFIRDGSQPLPSIRSCSTANGSDMQILSTLDKGEISAPYSQESCFSEDGSRSSVGELLSVTALGSDSSLNQILFESAPEGQSSMDQVLLESLPRSGSFLKQQDPLNLLIPTEPRLTEHVLPEPLPPPPNDLGDASPAGRRLSGKDISERLPPPSPPLAQRTPSGLLPPPNSPLQKQDLAEDVPTPHAERREPSETLVTSEQDRPQPVPPSPSSAFPEQSSSEPDLSTEPHAGERGVDESSLPVRSPSEEEDLPNAVPKTGSPVVKQDPLELMAEASPSSQGLDLSECPSLTRSPPGDALGAGLRSGSLAAEASEDPAPPGSSVSQVQDLREPVSLTEPSGGEEDLSEPLPPIHLLPAESLALPFLSVQGEHHPEFGPPGGLLAGEEGSVGSPSSSVDPSAPGRSPPEDQHGSEPAPPASSVSQEPNQTEAEPQTTEWPPEPKDSSTKLLPPTSSSQETPVVDNLPPRRPSTAPKSSLQLLSPSRSSSSELYQLFARIQPEAVPSRLYDELSTDTEMLSSSAESLAAETSQSFFMTQVDDASGPLLEPTEQPSKDQLTGPSHAVPEKYRGYEELLGGDPGPDFIEPVGIQHHVQALEKALRYPRVYRDSKARLDSFQKPYVPAPKKVPRVPPQQPRKDKAERLEEILLKMRQPTNIVHIPLVCVLRKKKENWRQYREALALLKEFREEYKVTVASCREDSESKTSKKLVGADQGTPSQMLGPLPEITVSEPEVEEPPAEVGPLAKDLEAEDLEESPSPED